MGNTIDLSGKGVYRDFRVCSHSDSLRISNLRVGFSRISSHVTQRPTPPRVTLALTSSSSLCSRRKTRSELWVSSVLRSCLATQVLAPRPSGAVGTWGDWRLRSRRRGWMSVEASIGYQFQNLGVGTSYSPSGAKVTGISNNNEIGHRLRVCMTSSKYYDSPPFFQSDAQFHFDVEKMTEMNYIAPYTIPSPEQ